MPFVFLFGRRAVLQKVDIEGNVRRSILPELQKQLGVSVEVGHIDSDYLSRVVLHDVVIGRDKRLPLGALAQAKTIILNLDVIGLIQRRDDPLSALNAVTLDTPQLYIQRDAAGTLNWQKILKSRPTTTSARWTGLITVRSGRILYEDATRRSASGRILSADARNASGTLRFSGSDPTTFRLAVARTYVSTTPIDNAVAIGEFDQGSSTVPLWVSGDISVPSAPAPLLADYAFPHRDVVALNGAVGGLLHLSYDAGAPPAQRLLAGGDITLRGVTGWARAIAIPKSKTPLVVANATGPLSFNGTSVSTSGLALTALDTPLRLAGQVTLPDVGSAAPKTPVFNIVAASRAIATNRLAALFPSAISLRGGLARATLRISGEQRNARVAGIVILPGFTLRHPQMGALSGAVLKTTLNYAGDLASGHLSSDFTLSDFGIRQNGNASVQGSALKGTIRLALNNRNYDGAILFDGSALRAYSTAFGNARSNAARGFVRFATSNGGTPLAADVTLIGFTARSGETRPRYGTLSGRNIRLLAASTDMRHPAWRGAAYFGGVDMRSIDIAAISPAAAAQVREIGLRDLGALEGSVRFKDVTGNGLRHAVANGALHLAQATVQGTKLNDLFARASFSNGTFNLSNARANSEFGAFTLAMAPGAAGLSGLRISAPRVILAAGRINPLLARWGVALDGTATGRLNVRSADGNGGYKAQFDFSLPETLVRRTRGPGQVQAVSFANSVPLAQLTNVRLRGDGTIQRDAHNRWIWNGAAELFAGHAGISGKLRDLRIGSVAFPAAFDGATLRNLRLLAGGNASSNAIPSIHGLLSAERVAWRVRNPRTSKSNLLPSATFTTSNANLAYLIDNNGVQAPRIEAGLVSLGAAGNAARPAHMTGHLAVRQGGLSGQLLVENVDAARTQKAIQPLFGASSNIPAIPLLRGLAFARADLTGTTAAPQAALQIRLYNGVATMPGRILPIDTARLTTTLSFADMTKLPLDDLTVWSHGARLKASGDISRTVATIAGRVTPTYALNLDAEMDDVRLSDIGALLADASPAADTDGLIGGSWHISGNLVQPRISGKTTVRLAQILGVAIDEAGADLYLENTPHGLRFGLANLTGRLGDATLSGRLLADVPKNTWRLQLKADGALPDRLLRAGARIASRTGNRATAAQMRSWQNIVLRGTLNADIDIGGSFKPDTEGVSAAGDMFSFNPVPQDGTINLTASDLRWRGRKLGEFSAHALVREDGIEIQDVTLRRPYDLPIGAPAPAVAIGGGETETGKTETIDAAKNDDALLQISGLFPTSPDATDLDTSVKVSNERLSFIQMLLRELEGSLRAQGTLVPSLDTIVTTVTSLPGSLEGRIGLDAHITGSWRRPVISLQTAIQEARLDKEILPKLSASFELQNGAVNIHSVELQQTTPASADGTEEEHETVLRIADGGRIVPGGEVSLDAELLNANLSQLAQWVPALRDIDGKPAMRGQITLFNFEVRGNTSNPLVTGSIEAEDLIYRNYTLDRLRVARFDIADGNFAVEPGNLTVVKGGFQSSAAWGKIPWSWKKPGPLFDAPLEVHFPLETKDFGALAGTFVPALAEVGADAFSGIVDVSGTLTAPHFEGQIALQNGRFRANPAAFGADFGVKGLTGDLRFTDGNTLQVDNLHGSLISAGNVNAASTHNLPATERNPLAAERAIVNPGAPPPTVAGDFTLAGKVALDLDPHNFAASGLSFASHRYDLQFSLKNGAYFSKTMSGLRNASLTAAWKTGDGDPRTSQNVSWNLQGAGSRESGKNKSKSGGGQLSTVAQVRLAPDFATGLDALLKSDFKGDVTLKGFGFSLRDAITGTVDGALTLGNAGAGTRTIAVPAVREALATRANHAAVRKIEVQDSAANAAANAAANGGGKVLGISGNLVLTDTEIVGAPIGEQGVAGLLPDAPVMKIKAHIGRNVQFETPTLRSEFDGDFDINGTPRNPEIIGDITTRSGQIRFPAATARLTEGTIRVLVQRDAATDTIRSTADIKATARGQAGKYQITLALDGPLDFGSQNSQNLKVSVTSTPYLSESEAFAQLTGTSLHDLESSDGSVEGNKANQAYASAIVSLFSAPLFSGIERSLSQALGLSNITLDYRLNEPLSVQFGKAVGDRIFVTYQRSLASNKLGQSESYTLRVDYRIKGNYQLGFQIDELNRKQVSIDKTWRF